MIAFQTIRLRLQLVSLVGVPPAVQHRVVGTGHPRLVREKEQVLSSDVPQVSDHLKLVFPRCRVQACPALDVSLQQHRPACLCKQEGNHVQVAAGACKVHARAPFQWLSLPEESRRRPAEKARALLLVGQVDPRVPVLRLCLPHLPLRQPVQHIPALVVLGFENGRSSNVAEQLHLSGVSIHRSIEDWRPAVRAASIDEFVSSQVEKVFGDFPAWR
mmetsp:Transcript_9246/g.30875  ORF Transcript_9246/g.30875 Transcript_9246/m.30875 type:complete len:216 (+) Transcript_9246:406-1053(+)